MRRIYKYPVPMNTDKFSIMLPVGAEVKFVGWQSDQLFMWTIVNSSASTKQKYFRLYGTGHDIDPSHKYLTTYFSGPFVMHLFEEP